MGKATCLNRPDLQTSKYQLLTGERTNEIRAGFQQSWVDTELFFTDLTDNYIGFERLLRIREFLADLKQNGGEQQFRIGTLIHILVISRSVNFGLRPDQKYLSIETLDTDFEVCLKDGYQIYRQCRVADLVMIASGAC